VVRYWHRALMAHGGALLAPCVNGTWWCAIGTVR